MSFAGLSTSPRTQTDETTLPGEGADLGGYRVLRRLGAGGMGQVFAAEDGEGQVVALKQLGLTDATHLVRFKREFRALADLSHPNLVRLGELVVLSSGLAFFTMELVEGQQLVRWVRQATPAGTAPNLHRLGHALRQLVEGVDHLHRHGRLHRDLKPSNVFVSGEGRVVILDFGLVLDLDEEEGARITATGQLVGTPAYMAPEQAQLRGEARGLGPAVDLYAVGVMLFECLTGAMPFVGSALGVILDKQERPAPDPRDFAEGVPDGLARLCRALLEVAPSHRPVVEGIVSVLDREIGKVAPSLVSASVRGPQLVGRADELAALTGALAQVSDDEEAVVVRLIGPRGRGKSALLEHFLQPLHDDHVILRGRCHQRESVPFKGVDSVVDALALYLRSLPEVERAGLRPRHLRELCELFPVLGGIWAESGRRGSKREPVIRRRLGVEALREILARVAEAAVLVIAIDDFHWADVDGLAILRELLMPPLPPALLLVLAYEPAASGQDNVVLAAIAEPGALRGARVVALELEPQRRRVGVLRPGHLQRRGAQDVVAAHHGRARGRRLHRGLQQHRLGRRRDGCRLGLGGDWLRLRLRLGFRLGRHRLRLGFRHRDRLCDAGLGFGGRSGLSLRGRQLIRRGGAAASEREVGAAAAQEQHGHGGRRPEADRLPLGVGVHHPGL
ncbi:MAG: serine/threonine-protein kinase PknK, partial [Myxococcales bacterium]|nr:serine/threonine-protein kinase PknK [Myxococcales bacterium]